jgi:hypothetical protein
VTASSCLLNGKYLQQHLTTGNILIGRKNLDYQYGFFPHALGVDGVALRHGGTLLGHEVKTFVDK